MPLLKTIESEGVVISALSRDPKIDFVSRYFGPQVGINEDPVTGSAHCILTPIWAKKLNKIEFNARQVSARGGDLQLSKKKIAST
jgi:predicted PhzF superfamily epimerase YddE/YHI9